MEVPSNIDPNIQSLDLYKIIDDTGNIYRTVAIIGKRSNQIAADLKQDLISKLAEFSSYSDTLEEIVENKEQIEIAKVYERYPKPTLIAIHEFQNNELKWTM